MRGKDTTDIGNVNEQRITPAYAGKSDEVLKMSYWDKDHPRLCGEKAASVKTIRFTSKDHPRLCGEKHSTQPRAYTVFRITPAYAGKSV